MPATRTDPVRHGRRRPPRRWVVYVAGHPDASCVGRSVVVGTGLELGRGGEALGPGGLDDDRISRAHARLVSAGDGCSVEDLGSHNGTWVDGRRVASGAVADGDVLTLGGVSLLLRHVEADGEAPRDTDLVGVSHALGEVMAQVRIVAPRPATVAVLGETGVGKERIARELHRLSRRTGRFVAINCGALAEGVLQSELFGHARGAFSGAGEARRGLVVEADGGTLLLDEIGDAPASVQVALLRLLEEGEVRAVGSDRPRTVDVRVVVATHRDLAELVREQRFRQDLMMRCYRWTLRVPPLRERPEDIGVLLRHFCPVALPMDVLVRLVRHPWPGNVRELVAVAQRLAVEAEVRGLDGVPAWLDEVVPVASTSVPRGQPDAAELEALLAAEQGNVKAVAQALGVSRRTLYRWLEDAGIDLAAIRGVSR